MREGNTEPQRTRGIWEVVKSPAGAAVLGLAGLLSGLVLGVYGLVAERQAQLKVSLVSLSSVFDLHRPVGGLDVSYEGKSLRSANKALWSLSLVVSNNGNAGLRRADFDERSPFAVEVVGGDVVDKPAMASAIDYLKEGVRFNATRSALVFEPFILDPTDSFQISLVVLSDQGVRPTVKTRGKIAGLRQIEVELPETSGPAASLASRIFGADVWWIQVVRGIAYGIGALFGFLLIGAASLAGIGVAERAKDKRRMAVREKQLATYKYQSTTDQGEANAALVKIYLERGSDTIASAARLRLTLKERRQMATQLGALQWTSKELAFVCRRRFPSFPGDRWLFRKLEEKGLASLSEGVAALSPAVEEAMDALIAFLDADVTRAELSLREYWQQEDVRVIPQEILAEHAVIIGGPMGDSY